MKQDLGRDAAYVQAGAAHLILFYKRNLGAQLGSPDGSHITAWASPDYHNIDIIQNNTSSINQTPSPEHADTALFQYLYKP